MSSESSEEEDDSNLYNQYGGVVSSDVEEDEETRIKNTAIRNRNALKKLTMMANTENPSVKRLFIPPSYL